MLGPMEGRPAALLQDRHRRQCKCQRWLAAPQGQSHASMYPLLYAYYTTHFCDLYFLLPDWKPHEFSQAANADLAHEKHFSEGPGPSEIVTSGSK